MSRFDDAQRVYSCVPSLLFSRVRQFSDVGWVCAMCVIGVLPVVDWSEISFRVGFTMTRLLGTATCSLSLTGRN